MLSPRALLLPQDQGLRGSLYSRDELMAKYGLQEGDDNEEEEEEEAAAGELRFGARDTSRKFRPPCSSKVS